MILNKQNLIYNLVTIVFLFLYFLGLFTLPGLPNLNINYDSSLFLFPKYCYIYFTSYPFNLGILFQDDSFPSVPLASTGVPLSIMCVDGSEWLKILWGIFFPPKQIKPFSYFFCFYFIHSFGLCSPLIPTTQPCSFCNFQKPDRMNKTH